VLTSIRRRIADSQRTFGEVLRNRDVRRLEASWAAALTAGWAFSVAIIVYTYDAGGAGLVGVALAIKLVPAAVASAPLATLADRVSRKRVLIGAELGLALSTAVIAILIAADAPVALVLAISSLLGVFTTALQPAVSAMLPSLCKRPEELTAANVVTSTIESLSMFAGPAIGGLVIGLTSSAALAAVTGGGFLISALLAARLPDEGAEAPADPDSEGNGESNGFLASVADGFRVVAGDHGLRLVVGLMAAQTFVDGALGVLIAVAALELLDTGEAGIGYLNSAVGVGALLGSLAAAGMVGRRLAPGFSVGLVLWGLPIAIVGVLTENVAALILFGVVGVGNILIDVAGLTMLQRAAPEAMLARVFGVLETLILTSVAVGSLITPLLLELIGNEATFLVVGGFLPVLAVLSWRSLERLDEAATVPGDALALLRDLPFFSPLELPALERLAQRLTRVRAAAGETLFRQGEPGETFYVIAAGRVEVLIDGARARTEGPGEYFGEIALLRDLPRTATVVALEPTELLALDGGEFLAALGGHPTSRAEADSAAAARLAHMRPALATH
jgi:MFS family permease